MYFFFFFFFSTTLLWFIAYQAVMRYKSEASQVSFSQLFKIFKGGKLSSTSELSKTLLLFTKLVTVARHSRCAIILKALASGFTSCFLQAVSFSGW